MIFGIILSTNGRFDSICGKILTIVLLHFLAHAPLSEHASLLEYRRTEVNCNIYNIGVPAFSKNSQNTYFRL